MRAHTLLIASAALALLLSAAAAAAAPQLEAPRRLLADNSTNSTGLLGLLLGDHDNGSTNSANSSGFFHLAPGSSPGTISLQFFGLAGALALAAGAWATFCPALVI